MGIGQGANRGSGALAILVAGLLVIGAPPALADDQLVQVSDNRFTPSAVAVKPGEKVTWNLPSSSNIHNVRLEDGSFRSGDVAPAPWTAQHTFPAQEKAYRYLCELHGGNGMSGVVYVNADGTLPPPTPSFTPSHNVARVGQSVAFSATAEPGPIVRYQWDFDGDGTFDVDTAQASVSHTYTTAGPRTVKLRVTDSRQLTGETTRSLIVTTPPTASLTVVPSPASAGQTVTFDGSASTDPDGTIAKYEWDLDAHEGFETFTGTTPTTTASYPSPGLRTVKLRVTDDLGVSSVTTQPLQIDPAAGPPPVPTTTAEPTPVPSPTGSPAPSTPKPVGCSALTGAQRADCLQKACQPLRGARRALCIQRSCRSVARSKRAGCARTSCRYLKDAKRRSCEKKYARKPKKR